MLTPSFPYWSGAGGSCEALLGEQCYVIVYDVALLIVMVHFLCQLDWPWDAQIHGYFWLDL